MGVVYEFRCGRLRHFGGTVLFPLGRNGFSAARCAWVRPRDYRMVSGMALTTATLVDTPEPAPEAVAVEEQLPARRRRLLAYRPDVLVLSGYVLLAVWVEAHYLGNVGVRVSMILPQDQSWFEWLLAHGAYSVRHLTNPMFSARQNAPSGVNMMANTSVLGVTIPLSPVTMLFGTHVSYLVMLGLGLAGTAASTYWVLSRHVVSSRAAAAVAGLVCGFAPGAVRHASGQPNFTAHFLVPFLILAMVRLGRSQRLVRDGVILALLVTFQFFVNEEILLATTVSTAVGFVIYALMRRGETRQLLARWLGGGAVGVGVALVLLAYPMWFQFAGPQSYISRIPFADWGEDLTGFVTFSRFSIANYTVVAESAIAGKEQNSWLGWPLFLVAVLAAVLLWRRGNLLARSASLTGLIFAALSLGPVIEIGGKSTGIPGPWAAIGKNTPVLQLVMPSRLSIVTVGAVGILVALLLDELLAAGRHLGSEGARVTMSAVGLVCAAVVTILPVPVPVMDYPAPPRFIASGEWRQYLPPGRTIVPVPLPDRAGALATFRWSVDTGQAFPIAAGYFLGRGPDGTLSDGATPRATTIVLAQVADTGVLPVVTKDMRRAVRDDLTFWKAGVVVVGHQIHEQALLRLLTDLLGPGTAVDDVWVWQIT
jgi:hypothetical protein